MLLARRHSNYGLILICNLNLPLSHEKAWVYIYIFKPSKFCDCCSITVYWLLTIRTRTRNKGVSYHKDLWKKNRKKRKTLLSVKQTRFSTGFHDKTRGFSLWGKNKSAFRPDPREDFAQRGGAPLLPALRPARRVTALPPRRRPAFLAATVLSFPLFLRIPTRFPPKKIQGKRKEKKEEVCTRAGVGGELGTHSSEEKRRPQRALRPGRVL